MGIAVFNKSGEGSNVTTLLKKSLAFDYFIYLSLMPEGSLSKK
jgi:hypothetical protein